MACAFFGVTPHRHVRSDKLSSVKPKTLPLVTVLGFAALAQAQSTEIPTSLQPPAGEQLILKTHAAGWQIYTCGAGTDGKPGWTLKAPEADLYDASGKLVAHHKAGPSWIHRDGSEVTGKAVAHADAPDTKSIAWLLVSAVGAFRERRVGQRVQYSASAYPRGPGPGCRRMRSRQAVPRCAQQLRRRLLFLRAREIGSTDGRSAAHRAPGDVGAWAAAGVFHRRSWPR